MAMNLKFAVFQKVEGPCVQVVNPKRRPVFLEQENNEPAVNRQEKQEKQTRKRGRPRKNRETQNHG